MVAQIVVNILERMPGVTAVSVIDLHECSLPLWDEGFWEEDERWTALWSPISDRLRQADAFVTVTPEWAGMAPPGLKNFFVMCSPAEVGHKPNLIVAVSAGRGGAYPVSELRAYSFKNNKICHIPDHVIVRDLERHPDLLSDSFPDQSVMRRMRWSISVLLRYAHALRDVRADAAVFDDIYENGM